MVDTNKNWTRIVKAEREGDILQIPLTVAGGKKHYVIGMVKTIFPQKRKAIIDGSKFIQSGLHVMDRHLELWDIDVNLIEGEVKEVEYSPDIMKKN